MKHREDVANLCARRSDLLLVAAATTVLGVSILGSVPAIVLSVSAGNSTEINQAAALSWRISASISTLATPPILFATQSSAFLSARFTTATKQPSRHLVQLLALRVLIGSWGCFFLSVMAGTVLEGVLSVALTATLATLSTALLTFSVVHGVGTFRRILKLPIFGTTGLAEGADAVVLLKGDWPKPEMLTAGNVAELYRHAAVGSSSARRYGGKIVEYLAVALTLTTLVWASKQEPGPIPVLAIAVVLSCALYGHGLNTVSSDKFTDLARNYKERATTLNSAAAKAPGGWQKLKWRQIRSRLGTA